MAAPESGITVGSGTGEKFDSLPHPSLKRGSLIVLGDRLGSLRSWLPVPTENRGIDPIRWFLLEANRFAVIVALLIATFLSILLIGWAYTFEMQQLLTETEAVQTVLNTFMSGIILLVSIVASINSIFLSYDITAIQDQEDRIEGMLEFRRELDEITDVNDNPTDPGTFLRVMAEVIHDRASELGDVTEGVEEELAEDIEEYITSIEETADELEASLHSAGGAEFGVLWLGLETDYGPMINRSRELASRHREQIPEDSEEVLDELIEALELFATGREYFKTLYYSREIATLSRTLLVVSLPSIIISATTILTIDANLLPEVWMFGLPPLLTFVAAAFTIALAPYVILTAYMLRVATVARQTAGSGPFGLKS